MSEKAMPGADFLSSGRKQDSESVVPHHLGWSKHIHDRLFAKWRIISISGNGFFGGLFESFVNAFRLR